MDRPGRRDPSTQIGASLRRGCELASEIDFGPIRKQLWNDLVNLHDAWAQYRFLFHDEERVRMLNACARWFFGLTQRLLLRDVILGISRLTDPVQSGKHSNLVIASHLLDPAVDQHPGLREQLQAMVDDATRIASSIRVHRHKYIAHRDHATALGAEDAPLPGIRSATITEAITAMEDAYNIHGATIHESHASFELTPIGGADALVRILEASERWQKWKEWHAQKESRP